MVLHLNCIQRIRSGEVSAVTEPSEPVQIGYHAFTPLQSMGETLRRNVEELSIPHRTSSAGDCVTVSIGGASMIPSATDRYLRLINIADDALYEAKRAGKNRVVTYETDRPIHAEGQPAAT